MSSADETSYDWFKEELIRLKFMSDGPALHIVASIGAVSSLYDPHFRTDFTSGDCRYQFVYIICVATGLNMNSRLFPCRCPEITYHERAWCYQYFRCH